jgi:hypothetical protein
MAFQSKLLEPKDVRRDYRNSHDAAPTILSTAFSHDMEPNVFTLESWRVRKMTDVRARRGGREGLAEEAFAIGRATTAPCVPKRIKTELTGTYRPFSIGS